MAKWYYLVDGQEVGPIEPSELKQLADSGRLKPHDTIRRADMAQLYHAKQVKGLFAGVQSQAGSPAGAASPAPAAVASPPAVSKAAQSGHTEAPQQVSGTAGTSIAHQQLRDSDNSFGSWYRTRLGKQPIVLQVLLWLFYGYLWIPIWWALSRSGESSGVQAANVPSASPVPDKLATTKTWQFRATIVGIGCLSVPVVLISLAFLAAIVAVVTDPEGFRQTVREAEQKSRTANPKFRVLSSFEQTPPPIEDAIASGKEVWLLHDYFLINPSMKDAVYVVVDNNQLEKVIEKQRIDATHAKALNLDGKVSVVWGEWKLRQDNPEDRTAPRWHFELRKDPLKVNLSFQRTTETDVAVVAFTESTTIAVEPTSRLASWNRITSSDVKYRANMAWAPDKNSSETDSGIAEKLAGSGN